MSFQKIAIIGRPNVGKSALFNRLLKKRVAIVDEMEGVTRDRIYGEGEFEGRFYILIDTAGIETTDHSELNVKILEQSRLAIEEADYCIFVVDGRTGVTRMDEEIAELLRKKHKPVCLAVNKIDFDEHAELAYPFYQLGFEKALGISASHGRNVYELLETVFSNLPEDSNCEGARADKEIISIIGRPNVGKSTLMNYLSKEPRCVVSPIAGTTRDAIEVEIEYNDKSYTFIDTAGIRRKNKEYEAVEKFAFIRTHQALEKSGICLFLIDPQDGITSQEKKFLSQIYELGKSCIIVINKWDLVKGFRMEHAQQALIDESPFLAIYPIIFISALTGRNIDQLYALIEKAAISRAQKLETSALNQFISKALQKNNPPTILNKRLRIYYITQVKSSPPAFMFFVNYANLMTSNYRKYLLNQMRETFDFTATPIQFLLRSKHQPKAEEQNDFS